jgi:predicted RNA binding protein YcfA (HicA-like mRNA interferase family)
MPRLRPEGPREVVRKLRRLGFEGPFGGGKHLLVRHPETRVKIPIPVHKGRDIPVGTLRTIIRLAGSTVQEWKEL